MTSVTIHTDTTAEAVITITPLTVEDSGRSFLAVSIDEVSLLISYATAARLSAELYKVSQPQPATPQAPA